MPDSASHLNTTQNSLIASFFFFFFFFFCQKKECPTQDRVMSFHIIACVLMQEMFCPSVILQQQRFSGDWPQLKNGVAGKFQQENRHRHQSIFIWFFHVAWLSGSVDCQVSAWNVWEACSVTCGVGVRQRTRTITAEAVGSGRACPDLLERTTCRERQCPRGEEIVRVRMLLTKNIFDLLG